MLNILIENSETEMTISEFLDRVKEIYSDHFPDSACSAKLVKILGKSIFIDFYLAKDKTEVANSIWQNDVFKCSFSIYLEGNPELDDPMPFAELTCSSSCIKTKPEQRYLYCDLVKVPFRKVKGGANKLLAAIEKYVQKLADTFHSLYDSDMIHPDDKELVDSKIYNIK